jgi:hypothetical protein
MAEHLEPSARQHIKCLPPITIYCLTQRILCCDSGEALATKPIETKDGVRLGRHAIGQALGVLVFKTTEVKVSLPHA